LRRNAEQLRIDGVAGGGTAHRAGIRPGGVLLEINGHPIRDNLDFQFYSADPVLDVVFVQDGKRKRVRFSSEKSDSHNDPFRPDRAAGTGGPPKCHCEPRLSGRSNLPAKSEIASPDGDRNLGLLFAPMSFRACGNKCIFCFSDQNPRGLRKSLYFKDEDYRLSFLFGNYVTLTGAGPGDLERIVDQRMSPLFVSIHAFDPLVRRKLLGISRDDCLWQKLEFLAKKGIELHGQVVLCPGINDGPVLEETVSACARLYPSLRSLALVPVGLTRHRKALPPLERYDAGGAKALVSWARGIQDLYQKKFHEPFVYLSDEFYLLAGRPLPSLRCYGDFWQSGNGVGMTARFLASFRSHSRAFPKSLSRPGRIVLATGVLAAPVLQKKVLPVLNRIRKLKAVVLAVPNRFYGETVTVSGLLAGRDIAAALGTVHAADAVAFIPSNCLNHGGLFLDGWTVPRLEKAAGRAVRVLEDFERFWELI
jgi:putative radical SAM enzyme (TIGR03279 family)